MTNRRAGAAPGERVTSSVWGEGGRFIDVVVSVAVADAARIVDLDALALGVGGAQLGAALDAHAVTTRDTRHRAWINPTHRVAGWATRIKPRSLVRSTLEAPRCGDRAGRWWGDFRRFNAKRLYGQAGDRDESAAYPFGGAPVHEQKC